MVADQHASVARNDPSHRRVVTETLRELCSRLGRAVLLIEIRRAIPEEQQPPHLDAVIGSLVRTGHVSSRPARRWEHEVRNVYCLADTNYPVVEEEVMPTRAEVVASVVTARWCATGEPVSAKEIRAGLRDSEVGRAILARSSFLPTVLNTLRKASGSRPPLLQSIALHGVRAQRWIPSHAEWKVPDDAVQDGTAADQVAVIVANALAAGEHIAVTPAHVRAAAKRLQLPLVTETNVLRHLAETARSRVASSAGRSDRRHPSVICVGEVRGQAWYTLPEYAQSGGTGEWSAPAHSLLGWLRWLEEWDSESVESELSALIEAGRVTHLRDVRIALLRRTVQRMVRIAERLSRTTPPVNQCVAARSDALARVANVTRKLADCASPRIATTVWAAGVNWLSATEVRSQLIHDFELGDDPPHVIAGFLAGEVRRMRDPNYSGRVGCRGRYRPKWRYESVSARLAAVVRWSSPDVLAMALHANAILGPLRAVEPLLPRVKGKEWSSIDRIAVLAILGDERGRPLLEAEVNDSTPPLVRQWATRALAMLDWAAQPGEASPWR